MTRATSRLDTATTRRRLMLAGERLPLAYDTTGSGDAGDAGVGSEAAGQGSPAGADGHVDGGDLDLDLDGLLGAADTAVARLGEVAAGRIHPDDLGGALKRLRKVRNRLEAVETAWLAQLRNRKVHRADGASSASTWARDQLGGSKKDAADQIRTADRLVDLPDTAGAFGDGDITRQAASAIARAMQDDRLRDSGDAERKLLAAARDGGPDLVAKTARELKATADVHAAEADAARQRARRYAHVARRGDGTVKIDALLDADNGEPFYTAFQALYQQARRHDAGDSHGHGDGHGTGDGHDGGLPAGAARSPRQRAADVLGELARRLLTTGQTPDVDGRAATVLVTIPESVLHGRLDDGPARLRFTGPIAPSTARRYACDAAIIPIVLNGNSVPIDIGRASREPTTGQRRCLAVRDRASCRRCGADDCVLIAHHCTHWADGGPTDLHNLILLCHRCHQLCHEGGWNAAWQPDNTVIFTHPNGGHIIRPPP